MDLKTEEDIGWITAILDENLQYARRGRVAKVAFAELVELMNDVIDEITKAPKESVEITNSPKWVFLATCALPSSFGIYVDFLAGNIPVCFMQLRLMIESQAMYFKADTLGLPESFFFDKISFAEELQKRTGMSDSKLIRSVDKDAEKLWHKCSGWMHSQPRTRKLVEMVAAGGVPSWALALPMSYTKADAAQLMELSSDIAAYRKVFLRIIEKWN